MPGAIETISRISHLDKDVLELLCEFGDDEGFTADGSAVAEALPQALTMEEIRDIGTQMHLKASKTEVIS